MTPAVPAHPPSSPLPQPTAHALLRRLGFTLAVTVAAVLVTLLLFGTPDWRMAPATAIGVVVVLAIGGWMTRGALVSFRSRLLEEIQAGYVTTTFEQGGFWLAHRDGPAFARGRNVLGWDWRGLWVLDPAGGVVSPPDRAVDLPACTRRPIRRESASSGPGTSGRSSSRTGRTRSLRSPAQRWALGHS